MQKATTITLTFLLALALPACSDSSQGTKAVDAPAHGSDAPHAHTHGTIHDDHESIELDAVIIDGKSVQLAQSHGPVNAGEEEHIIIKINDAEIISVRAWIGTVDRTLSFVGKGEYDPKSGTYEVHTMAPDPLPENAMWWIEIEKGDGTKLVASAEPIM